MVVDNDNRQARVCVKANWSFSVNNAIMVAYALATSYSQTALFHSSVVSHQGPAYMFLSHSGTGKSTHSSLWLNYIEGTELVNDDNPVVRIIDGKARLRLSMEWQDTLLPQRELSCGRHRETRPSSPTTRS